MNINADRLSYYFTTLCEIDSPSKGESRLSTYLQDLFINTGAASVIEDDSAKLTGSECGNLIVKFPGTQTDAEPIFFNCHLDVINPCIGVKVRKTDEIFYSAGDTVLGADDKAGIAILIEVLLSLLQGKDAFTPVELVFTTCEEIGLLGAKALDTTRLTSKYGYSLDSTGIDNVIIGAPASYGVTAEFFGQASHAGLRPEFGINAIQLAANAVSKLPLGKLDKETTANIGTISGGTATNIVPDYVRLDGEIRSHNSSTLHSTINQFRTIFQAAISNWQNQNHPTHSNPRIYLSFPEQYPAMHLTLESLPVVRANNASHILSRPLQYIQAGGGSDANFFNSFGLQTAILGIGMENVHSLTERIKLADMVRTAELIHTLLTI